MPKNKVERITETTKRKKVQFRQGNATVTLEFLDKTLVEFHLETSQFDSDFSIDEMGDIYDCIGESLDELRVQ